MLRKSLARPSPRVLLAFFVLLAGAGPAQAQLGIGNEQHLEVRVRPIGVPELLPAARPPIGRPSAIGGSPGSGKALDLVAFSMSAASLSYEVRVEGIWQPPSRNGESTGVEDHPFSGLRIRATKGSIRYRVSYVGSGFSEWAEDGVAVEKPGAKVEAVEVEHRWVARAGITLSYRALFRGEEWTPWTPGGEPLTPKASGAALIAFEVRSSVGVRYEASLSSRGWQSTRLDGSTAGDPTGKRYVDAFRVFGGDGLVKYRARTSSGWGPWNDDGVTCQNPGPPEPLTGIELQLAH